MNRIIDVLRSMAYVPFGVIVMLTMGLYLILTFPLFLYRFLLCKVIFPHVRENKTEKVVTANGHAMATEFLRSKSHIPPRCSLVTAYFVEGSFPFDTFASLLEERWFNYQNPESGEPMYPELKQYIEDWMGFMFWRQDKHFSLANHLHKHTIDPNASEEEGEAFLQNLLESLLNDPFARRRSPWEYHLVYNYRSKDLLQRTEEKTITVFIFRWHHALMDGFSMLSLNMERLFGVSFESAKLAKPKPPKRSGTCLGKLGQVLTVPIKFFHDAGYALSPVFKSKTPWHVPDEKKTWKQIHSVTGPLPIQRVKDIKNEFGVSFTSVILSCVSAALAENYRSKGCTGVSEIQFGTAFPRPNHPKKLRNHSAGTLLDISIDHKLDPIMRLKETEARFQNAKGSLLPTLSVFGLKAASSQIAPLARHLFTNRTLAMALSNFPSTGVVVDLEGHNALSSYFLVGGFMGVVGIVFSVVNYHDHLRIAVTAENAVMSRSELETLTKSMVDEMDRLYDLAFKDSRCTVKIEHYD